MTDLLKQAFVAIEKLPPSQQDLIAQRLLEELEDDNQWEETFSDPRSEIVLDQLISRAKHQIAQGNISDLDDIL
jgi:hypothetical protein